MFLDLVPPFEGVMTIELDDFESSCDISSYLTWALETGIWDGRRVSWIEASDFQSEVQSRILGMLLENPDNPVFEQLAAQLAWIGSPSSDQSLLARELQELDFSNGDLILQAGLKKSVSKFWKKHKKEILIGAAIVAVLTVVVVVAVSTAGTGVGAAAAAGGAALGGISKKDDAEKEKRPKDIQAANTIASPTLPFQQLPDLPRPNNLLTFNERGIVFNGQYSSYTDILLNHPEPSLLPRAPSPAATPWTPSYSPPPFPQMHPDIAAPWYPYQTDILDLSPPFLEADRALPQNPTPSLEIHPPIVPKTSFKEEFVKGMVLAMSDNFVWRDPYDPMPTRPVSMIFSTEGKRTSDLSFLGGNGMNTKLEEAISHANHLAQYTEGYAVDWVYNKSNGPVIDVTEILILNLPGISPLTAEQHLSLWTSFHENNLHRPYAKCLQIGHSQDSIHIRNALEKASPEIRNRVIGYLFGPAVMIPEGLCFHVEHYACEGDMVPYAEIPYTCLTEGVLRSIEVAGSRQKLIIVPRHPDTKSPHDFQNPAFNPIKKNIIQNYIKRNGEYK